MKYHLSHSNLARAIQLGLSARQQKSVLLMDSHQHQSLQKCLRQEYEDSRRVYNQASPFGLSWY